MVSRRKASAETPTEDLATPTSVASNGHAQQELAPASSNGVAHFEILNPAPTNGAHEASDPGESGAPPRRRTRSRSAKPDETAVEPSEAQVVQAILGPAATAKVEAPASPVAHGARSAGAPEAAPSQDRPQQRQPDGDRTERPESGNQDRGDRPDGRRERRWGRDRFERDRNDRGGNNNNNNRQQQFERQDRLDRPPREERFEGDEPQRDRPPRADRIALPALNITEMQTMAVEELTELANQMQLQDIAHLRRPDLILRLLQGQAEARGNIFSGGFLEVSDDGNYGFLRGERMLPGPHDIYVSQSQLRRFALRPGDYVTGQIRQARDNEKYYGLLKVDAVNGDDPEVAKRRPFFENLTAIFPREQMKLETTPDNLTHRIIDLIAPVGRGQRGLIVSPPKAGKTMLLKNIANGISANYPDVHLIVLLIGERPEEVTDMQRTVRGEVISSTFDEPVEDHTRVAEMALERAKRLVEMGKDVVILMDSITRLTRAYNLALPPSGRTLSGGVDPVALYPPKRLFGAARKCEEGGSLTVLATCLVDTGSRMDEVVFEEFKGTGNLELRLDRKLAERRFYPAIDIQASSTRREELLLDEKTLKGVYLMRRMTAMISQNAPNQTEATERLLERLARTTTNEEFVASLKTDL